MSSKVTTKITKVHTRVKKDGSTNGAGYKICSNCGGDGVVKTRGGGSGKAVRKRK